MLSLSFLTRNFTVPAAVVSTKKVKVSREGKVAQPSTGEMNDAVIPTLCSCPDVLHHRKLTVFPSCFY